MVERWRVLRNYCVQPSFYRWANWVSGGLGDDFSKISGMPELLRSRRWVPAAARMSNTSPGTLNTGNKQWLVVPNGSLSPLAILRSAVCTEDRSGRDRDQEWDSGEITLCNSACLPHEHVSNSTYREDLQVLQLWTQGIKCRKLSTQDTLHGESFPFLKSSG